MPGHQSPPDLNAFMDAYATLGVPYGASRLDVRQAFKRQTRAHHPDRFPPGSPEQLQATQRMAAANAAYALIKDAPLRYHRISTGSRPYEPWTGDELDAALHRARQDAQTDRWIGAGLSTVGVCLLLFWRGGFGLGQPLDIVAGTALGVVAYCLAAETRMGRSIWNVIYLIRFGRSALRSVGDLTDRLPSGH